MSWFNRKKQPEQTEERSSTFDYLMYNTGANYGTSKAMLLSTVYRCVEVISDSVAQLPLEPYKIDGAIAMIQALGMYLDTPHYANEIITI